MQTDPFEHNVRRIVNTSADEGIRFGVRDCDDPAILREALAREQHQRHPRATLVAAICARLRKLEKEEAR
jgi:hypothetical protein